MGKISTNNLLFTLPPLLFALSGIFLLLLPPLLILTIAYLLKTKPKTLKSHKPPDEPPVEEPPVEDPPFSPHNSQPFYCIQCGKEISPYQFQELGGLCRNCRGITIQDNFPSPPGFPKLP